MFSKENLAKVQEEIWKGKKLIDIINTRNELKKLLSEDMRFLKTLEVSQACHISDTVVEP